MQVGDERQQAPQDGSGAPEEGEPDLLRRREEGTRHVQVGHTAAAPYPPWARPKDYVLGAWKMLITSFEHVCAQYVADLWC